MHWYHELLRSVYLDETADRSLFGLLQFVYVNAAFSPSPDECLWDIYQVCQTTDLVFCPTLR